MSLVGCATTQQDQFVCKESDWFEQGRQAGAQGQPFDSINDLKAQCSSGAISAQAETLYRNGHNSGLVEYCSPENGFQLGRMGAEYRYVCPSTMEPLFLKGLERGKQVRDLERKNKELEARIDSVLQEMNSQRLSVAKRTQLEQELNLLHSRRSQYELELNRANKMKN